MLLQLDAGALASGVLYGWAHSIEYYTGTMTGCQPTLDTVQMLHDPRCSSNHAEYDAARRKRLKIGYGGGCAGPTDPVYTHYSLAMATAHVLRNGTRSMVPAGRAGGLGGRFLSFLAAARSAVRCFKYH